MKVWFFILVAVALAWLSGFEFAKAAPAAECVSPTDVQNVLRVHKHDAWGVRFDATDTAAIVGVAGDLFDLPVTPIKEAWAIFDVTDDSQSGLFLFDADGCLADYLPIGNDDMRSLFDALNIPPPDGPPTFHVGGTNGQSI